jgi:hypothetical protein
MCGVAQAALSARIPVAVASGLWLPNACTVEDFAIDHLRLLVQRLPFLAWTGKNLLILVVAYFFLHYMIRIVSHHAKSQAARESVSVLHDSSIMWPCSHHLQSRVVQVRSADELHI